MVGLIPQDFIDSLLQRIDIVDVIDNRVPLIKGGRDYKACCPFHEEKTPSFTVSQPKQFYHCFGCGAHGTAISFLMNYAHMDFREAVESLAAEAGMEIPSDTTSRPSRPGTDSRMLELLAESAALFQSLLKSHPGSIAAKDYLKERGFRGETAAGFGIGYSPDAWDTIAAGLGGREIDRNLLHQAGMLIERDKGGFYDRFRDRIMFPIEDYRGRIVGFGGRALDDGEPKYLNSPESPVFHKGSELYGLFKARGAIKRDQRCFVVEGYMDVVALAQHGIENAVATLGTATTRQHLDRLFRFTNDLIFCFDGDRAGRDAAWRALEVALPVAIDGRQISFLFLPDGEDPDTLVRGAGKQAFLDLAEQALPLPEFLIQRLESQTDTRRMDGRARLVELARPYLGRLPDGALKTLVSQRITEISGLHQPVAQRRTSIYGGLRRTAASRPAPKTLSPVAKAISLLLQHPEINDASTDIPALRNIEMGGIDLLIDLALLIEANPQLTTAGLLERFRQSDHHGHLEKLASHDHLLGVEDLKPTFLRQIDMIRQYEGQSHVRKTVSKGDPTALRDALEKQKILRENKDLD